MKNSAIVLANMACKRPIESALAVVTNTATLAITPTASASVFRIARR
jgi:hypothetical protein